MDKQEINIDPLFQNISQLSEKGQQTIIRSVNYSQLYVNYHIGKYIVDDEQDGIRRAQYGKRLIKTLSERLTSQYGMGFSAKNLELMRNFFLLYSKTQTLSALLEPEQKKTVTESGSIPQTVSAKLGPFEMTLPVDNNQIFAAKYQTVLPNKEQLKQILEEGYNG